MKAAGVEPQSALYLQKAWVAWCGLIFSEIFGLVTHHQAERPPLSTKIWGPHRGPNILVEAAGIEPASASPPL